MNDKNLWAGRFAEPLAADAHRFTGSIDTDIRFRREDIAGSIAHVRMLGACGIITPEESAAIVAGLQEVGREIEEGSFVPGPEHEDIHMAIEGRLIEKLGPLGGKLHTARSRNDQVALDMRLYLRRRLDDLLAVVDDLTRTLVELAAEHADTLMPGYTHMQRAQPVLLAHHLLAYVAMFDRDRERFEECRRRANRSPLGAAAFAGTSFPIDREMVAADLGFDGVVENSIDAVSDRDHMIEAASACSIAMMHASRMAEELVLWSTREFGFVTIGDAYATGSSIMPQKKNPDIAELVRGRTGVVYGALVNLLVMMKGLPLAYNRDMQADKAPLFDALDTAEASLGMLAAMLRSCTFSVDHLAAEAGAAYSTATELADYLVRKGLPFRSAHEITGRIVAHCEANAMALDELDLPTLQGFSERIASDVAGVLVPAESVRRKVSAGSTAPAEVALQIERRRARLAQR